MDVRSLSRRQPLWGQGVYVDPSAQVIGDVDLADDVFVGANAIVRGDVCRISVGARSNIQKGARLCVARNREYAHGGASVSIGQDVTIGPGAMLHVCSVADGSLIGARSTIMDGVHVERHAIVAAGALVASGQAVREGEMWAGVPAHYVRHLTAEEIEQILYSAQHRVHLKNLDLLRSVYAVLEGVGRRQLVGASAW